MHEMQGALGASGTSNLIYNQFAIAEIFFLLEDSLRSSYKHALQQTHFEVMQHHNTTKMQSISNFWKFVI